MLHLFEYVLAALTEKQVDELIKHLGTLVAAFSSLVSLLGVGFLIWRQSKNKTAITEAIKENTELSASAFTVANGHNSKIVELREEVKAAVEEIKTTKTSTE